MDEWSRPNVFESILRYFCQNFTRRVSNAATFATNLERTVKGNLEDFAAAREKDGNDGRFFDMAEQFLRNDDVSTSPTLVDHRYFYVMLTMLIVPRNQERRICRDPLMRGEQVCSHNL